MHTNGQCGEKLIKNFNDFEKGLTSWSEKSLIEHTLPNFKAHSEREYQALKRFRGKTVRNTEYFQQANAITNVLEAIKQKRAEMIQEVKKIRNENHESQADDSGTLRAG